MVKYNLKNGYISSSLLKLLADNPIKAKALIDGVHEEPSESLILGTLVDYMLTTPEKIEEEFFVVNNIKIPEDKSLNWCNKYIEHYKELLNNGNEITDELNDITILKSRKEAEYDSRLKDETAIKKFKEELMPYINIAITTDKTIISSNLYNTALSISKSVKESPFLQFIFNPNADTEVFFQVYIEAEFYNTKFSGTVDCVVVNKKSKTVDLYDFKTYDNKFEFNYWNYKYYYQESLYTALVNYVFNPNTFDVSNVKSSVDFSSYTNSGYNVNQLKFIAVNTRLETTPVIFYTYDNLWTDVLQNGYIQKYDYKVEVKSIKYLAEEFNYRINNNDWLNDYEMIKNKYKQMWKIC